MTPEAQLQAFLDSYLSMAHIERPSRGCAIPTLGAEAARSEGEVRDAFTAGIAGMIDKMAALVPGATTEEKRARAMTVVAEAVGTLMLTRAVAPGPLRDEILTAVRRHLIEA
jgi:TetR/AcrR family transcriptional repressor of nem operon